MLVLAVGVTEEKFGSGLSLVHADARRAAAQVAASRDASLDTL